MKKIVFPTKKIAAYIFKKFFIVFLLLLFFTIPSAESSAEYLQDPDNRGFIIVLKTPSLITIDNPKNYVCYAAPDTRIKILDERITTRPTLILGGNYASCWQVRRQKRVGSEKIHNAKDAVIQEFLRETY